ncbi:hypothetical protein BSR28_05120 [Boudabousia liubingyangii]|uniref:hypothetical protein n=1 Tax=Boudabousia liubingyangii TaxID=1921764 RepID=UPI00093BB524|nr:hypothetical protein [Boudabousia liubingyangii]OKL46820.1 hypothetical protein BSR28_05120 [Boudabousia liubingyangii]
MTSADSAASEPLNAPTDEELAQLLEATRQQLKHGTQLARSIRDNSDSLFAPLRPHTPVAPGTYQPTQITRPTLEPEDAPAGLSVSGTLAASGGATSTPRSVTAGSGEPTGEGQAIADLKSGHAQSEKSETDPLDPDAFDPAILPAPGQVVLCLAQIPEATAALDMAERLVARTQNAGREAAVLLGGAKTVLPGEGERLRSGADFTKYREAHPEAALVVVIIDSPVEAHHRAAQKLLAALPEHMTWAPWDARRPYGECIDWLARKPYDVPVDVLTLHHVWEAPEVHEYRRLPVKIAWLDGAPASAAMWESLSA